MKNHRTVVLFVTFQTKLGFARFDQIDVFIRVYDGTRYLVLFGSKIYDFIYNRIR